MPTPSWHPILLAQEPEPGHWELIHQPIERDPGSRVKIGDIRLVKRVGGSKGYRCLALLAGSDGPVDLGLERTLREATMLVYSRHVAAARGVSRHDGYPPYYPAYGVGP